MEGASKGSVVGTISFADKLKQGAISKNASVASCPAAKGSKKDEHKAEMLPINRSQKMLWNSKNKFEDTGWKTVIAERAQSDKMLQNDTSSKERPAKNENHQATNYKKELTEEELEIMREKRRERRKREKETKKKLREEKKRAEVYAPKSSKINLVSADALYKSGIGSYTHPSGSKQNVNNSDIKSNYTESCTVTQDVTSPSSVTKNLKFLDEEYPTLNFGGTLGNEKGMSKCLNKAKDSLFKDEQSLKHHDCERSRHNPKSRTISENESGSDWETDEENLLSHTNLDIDKEFQDLNTPFWNIGALDMKFVRENNSHPKSILRKRLEKSDPEMSASASSSSTAKNIESWSNVVKFSKSQADTPKLKENSHTSETAKSMERNALKGTQKSKGKGQETKTDESATIKKVKKKDPITLDLLQAMQVK